MTHAYHQAFDIKEWQVKELQKRCSRLYESTINEQPFANFLTCQYAYASLVHNGQLTPHPTQATCAARNFMIGHKSMTVKQLHSPGMLPGDDRPRYFSSWFPSAASRRSGGCSGASVAPGSGVGDSAASVCQAPVLARHTTTNPLHAHHIPRSAPLFPNHMK